MRLCGTSGRTVLGVPVRASLSVVALLFSGACGGDGADDSSRAAQELPRTWDHKTTKITDVETARSVVRHQQEDHCGPQRLVEVTCTDADDSWRCEYRTDRGSGTTEIEKDFGDHGEAVLC